MTGQQAPAKAPNFDIFAIWRGAVLLTGLCIAALMAQAAAADEHEKVITSHGYSFFGDLKYPADYEHFDYVNPDAPKGGEISLYAPGTFDSMNP